MLRLGNFALLALLLVHAWLFLARNSEFALKADLAVYCESSTRLYAGQDIYQHIYDEDIYTRIFQGKEGDGKHFRMHYFYPPFLALAFRPLANLPFEEAKRVWNLFSYLCYLLAAVGCTLLLAGRFSAVTRLNLVLLLFAAFEPFYLSFYEGQINLLIMALLAFYLLCSTQGRELSAGTLLALAAAIKISPAILVLEIVYNRRWKALGSLLIVLAALTLVLVFSAAPFSGYQNFFSKFTDLSAGRLELSQFMNVALIKLVLLPFGLDMSEVARRIISVLLLVGGIWAIALCGRLKNARSQLCQQGVLIVLMILLSPTTWFHHLVWVILPFTVCLKWLLQTAPLDIKKLCWLCGSYLLLAKGHSLHALAMASNKQWIWATGMLPNLALIVTVILLIHLAARKEPTLN